jgi:tight adherence protein B
MGLIALLVFVSTFWCGSLVLESLQRRRFAVNDRLSSFSVRPQQAATRWSDIPTVERVMGKFGVAARIELLLDQADVAVKPFEFVLIVLVSILVFCAIGLLLRNPAASVILPVVGGLLPIGWLFVKRNRRHAAFIRQLPDALQSIASALRAGLGFGQGMAIVASHLPPPIAVEFARAQREMTLGLSVDEALQNMSRRIGGLDLEIAVSGILINRQIGGNLAELLDHIVATLRERVKLKNFIQVQSASQRLSAWIIIGVGPVLLLVLLIGMRQYTSYLLNTDLGHAMLLIALLLQLMGALVIRRIVAIEV